MEDAASEIDDEEVFFEGRVVSEAHSRRERNPKIRERLIQHRKRSGSLQCDICECLPLACEFGEAMFEAHHLLPLALAAERRTTLADMALLCANCHRLIHRAIARGKRWLTIREAKGILSRIAVSKLERHAASKDSSALSQNAESVDHSRD
jgi:5-methylcytosine-specific restriction enzyme A